MSRRVFAQEPSELQNDWVQYKPALRYVQAQLFTSLTYVVLPVGASFRLPSGPSTPMPADSVVTVQANCYLVNDNNTFSIIDKATFETQWEAGP